MPGTERLAGALLGWVIGCSATASPSSQEPRPRPEVQQTASRGASGSGAATFASDTERGDAAAAILQSPELPFGFRRVEARPVSALAAGKPPKIAILAGSEASVFDGRDFRRFAFAEGSDEDLALELFFGRDDQPRVMGYQRGPGGARPFYRRLVAGRFRPEPSELGPLAGPGGALYGVLGHADPEVVCKPLLFCLVKRVTGWTRAPAHSEPARIVLAGATAWALHSDRIERLEGNAWAALLPPRNWRDPVALFVDADGAVWVAEREPRVITRLVGDRWEALSSPVAEPLAIGGSAPGRIWVAGSAGAALFDGAVFHTLPGVVGPLHAIAFSDPDLWLAGAAGLYRGVRAEP